MFIHSCVCDSISHPHFIFTQEKQTKDALTRKQQKGKKKGQEEESNETTELLKRPKEYTVKFTFPDPPPLSPPILGLHSELVSRNVTGYECFIQNAQMRFSKWIKKNNRCTVQCFFVFVLENTELNTFVKI